MKKMVACLIALCLLFPISFVLADDVTLDLTELSRYETVQSICWLGNDLYVLGSKGVYSWQAGAEKMTVDLDLSEIADYAYMKEEPEDEAEAMLWARAIRYLFEDEENVYGVHPYTGQVFRIDDQGMTAIAAMPQEILYSENMMSYREIQQIVYAGNTLFVLLGTDDYEDYSKTELFAFDLQTSNMEPVELDGVLSIFTGPAGKLLALCEESANQVIQYDVESGESTTTSIALEDGEQLSGLVWDEAGHRYARLVIKKKIRLNLLPQAGVRRD